MTLETVEIGDRSAVGKIFLIKRRFLEKRSNNRLFELQREVTRSKTEVDNACDNRCKYVRTVLEERSWNSFQSTLLIRAG